VDPAAALQYTLVTMESGIGPLLEAEPRRKYDIQFEIANNVPMKDLFAVIGNVFIESNLTTPVPTTQPNLIRIPTFLLTTKPNLRTSSNSISFISTARQNGHPYFCRNTVRTPWAKITN